MQNLSHSNPLKPGYCHLIPPQSACRLSPSPTPRPHLQFAQLPAHKPPLPPGAGREGQVTRRAGSKHRSPWIKSLGGKSRPFLLSAPNAGKVNKSPEHQGQENAAKGSSGQGKNVVRGQTCRSLDAFTLIPANAGAVFHYPGIQVQSRPAFIYHLVSSPTPSSSCTCPGSRQQALGVMYPP